MMEGEGDGRWSFRDLCRRKQEFAALPEAEQQPYLARAEEVVARVVDEKLRALRESLGETAAG